MVLPTPQWRRAREQAKQLSRLREHVTAPVIELPFLFVPALGAEELRMLATPLQAALDRRVRN